MPIMSIQITQDKIPQILREESVCSAFYDYLVDKHQDEFLLFWLEVEDYKITAEVADRKTRAQEIYNKFFDSSSKYEITLSPELRERLDSELNNADQELFNLAQRVIFSSLVQFFREFGDGIQLDKHYEKAILKKKKIKLPVQKQKKITLPPDVKIYMGRYCAKQKTSSKPSLPLSGGIKRIKEEISSGKSKEEVSSSGSSSPSSVRESHSLDSPKSPASHSSKPTLAASGGGHTALTSSGGLSLASSGGGTQAVGFLNLLDDKDMKQLAKQMNDKEREKEKEKEKEMKKSAKEAKRKRDKKKSKSEKTTPITSPKIPNGQIDLIDQLFMEPRFELGQKLLHIAQAQDKTDQISTALMELAMFHDQALPLLQLFFDRETEAFQGAPTTLFRTDSAATTMMSKYLTLTAERYLSHMLTPMLNRLESDFPDGIGTESDAVAQNADGLLALAQCLLQQVKDSAYICPPNMRTILKHIKQTVDKWVPNMGSTIIGSLLFLRFLCPAIVSPDRHNLRTAPSPLVRKVLIIVSKLIQNLVNGVQFDGSKEEHMVPLNGFLSDENRRYLELFLNELVDTSHIAGVSERPYISVEVRVSAVLLLRNFMTENVDEVWSVVCQSASLSAKFIPLIKMGMQEIPFVLQQQNGGAPLLVCGCSQSNGCLSCTNGASGSGGNSVAVVAGNNGELTPVVLSSSLRNSSGNLMAESH